MVTPSINCYMVDIIWFDHFEKLICCYEALFDKLMILMERMDTLLKPSTLRCLEKYTRKDFLSYAPRNHKKTRKITIS